MFNSIRYKIVLWMVWVQIALVPIVVVMMSMADYALLWRWDLSYHLMMVCYILGLTALPVSLCLKLPKLLKWWLRLDFLISPIIAFPMLLSVKWINTFAEDGNYMLYRAQGFFPSDPSYVDLGKKEGLFIHRLQANIRRHPCGEDIYFRADTLKGCFYGLCPGESPAAWVGPVDSVKYRRHAEHINALIDSLYRSQPLLAYHSYKTFVFPDDFSEINYNEGSISYGDYDIEYTGGDSVSVRLPDNFNIRLFFPKDSIGDLSPKSVRTFIERLQKGKQYYPNQCYSVHRDG